MQSPPNLKYELESRNNMRIKKCFMYQKGDCWSANHTQEERDRAYNSFKQRLKRHNKPFAERDMR